MTWIEESVKDLAGHPEVDLRICFTCEAYGRCCSCGRGTCRHDRKSVTDLSPCHRRRGKDVDWRPIKEPHPWIRRKLKDVIQKQIDEWNQTVDENA